MQNEMFVDLIALARHNHAERDRLLSIVNLPFTQRQDIVKQLIVNMRNDGAPQAMIRTMAYLTDDHFASAVRSELSSNAPSWLTRLFAAFGKFLFK